MSVKLESKCRIHYFIELGDGIGAPHVCLTHHTYFYAPDPCPKVDSHDH